MLIDFNSNKSIYLQLAEGLEDAILTGIYQEESQIPSTTEISVSYKINPATARKGINLLVDQDIVYKKRGVGMFVKEGAVKKIKNKRVESFYNTFIISLVQEASKIGLSKNEIVKMIERVEQ